MPPTLLAVFALFAGFTVVANAETHTIRFDNRCGYGTPRLIKGNDILTSTSYTANGSFSSAIAYLDTGNCLFNGEGCSVVEMTLTNPSSAAGSGSSVDITLIPPLAFSVPTSFQYTGACEGQGTSCATGDCKTAFFHPDDTWVQVACLEDDADLLISFCADGSDVSSSESTIQEPSTNAESSSTIEATSASYTAESNAIAVPSPSASSVSSRTRPSCLGKRSVLQSRSRDRSQHSRRRHIQAGGWS